MAFRVRLTARADRDLRRPYRIKNVEDSRQAAAWFGALEAAIISLEDQPARCPTTAENDAFRHLLFGTKPNVYRIIFMIDLQRETVRVAHIRHSAQRRFTRSDLA